MKEVSKSLVHVAKYYKLIEDKIKKSIFYLLIETTKPFDSKAFIEFYEIDLTKNFKKNLKPTQSINLEIYTFDNENLICFSILITMHFKKKEEKKAAQKTLLNLK